MLDIFKSSNLTLFGKKKQDTTTLPQHTALIDQPSRQSLMARDQLSPCKLIAPCGSYSPHVPSSPNGISLTPPNPPLALAVKRPLCPHHLISSSGGSCEMVAWD